MSIDLRHGDALGVLRELPAGSVDAVVTDPPFKISQEYGTATDPDNLIAVASVYPVAAELVRVVKPGAVCAMFYDTRILPLALDAMRTAGWKYLRGLTLYRRWGAASLLNGWMSTSDFILIFATPGARPQFHGEVKHDVYVRATKEPTSYGHPAQKPLDHCRHIVSRVTPPGGTVIDPYMGTGTVGVAAVESGRSFIGVELERRHFDTASERLKTLVTPAESVATLSAPRCAPYSTEAAPTVADCPTVGEEGAA